MASSGKTLPTAAAVLLVLVFTATVVALASASRLTVFAGPGCAGKTKDINSVCGCFSINGYQGGFHFVFTEGQRARLYTSFNCQGAYTPLNKETRICSHHNYKIVLMIC